MILQCRKCRKWPPKIAKTRRKAVRNLLNGSQRSKAWEKGLLPAEGAEFRRCKKEFFICVHRRVPRTTSDSVAAGHQKARGRKKTGPLINSPATTGPAVRCFGPFPLRVQ